MTNSTINNKLCSLVKDQPYNSDLRKQISALGLKRFGGLLWIDTTSGTRYELVLTEDENPTVCGLALIEKNSRIILLGDAPKVETTQECGIDKRTLSAFMRRSEEGKSIMEDLIPRWNHTLYTSDDFATVLKQYAPNGSLSFEDFLFLPNPTGKGSYIFGMIKEGLTASRKAWLNLPKGKYIIQLPSDKPESVIGSLSSGSELHAFEVEKLKNPEEAAQFTMRVLNGSQTSYADILRSTIGRTEITMNDFFRNRYGEICRIEITQTPEGPMIHEVPVIPTFADCIESLLAKTIKKNL